MNASHDQTDHVDRARLVESFGAHDDSLAGIWAVQSRVTQSEWTAPVHGAEGKSTRRCPSRRGASECRKVKYKAKTLSGMLSKLTQQPGESAARCKTKENDTSVTRVPCNDESSKNNPISEKGVVDWKTLQL